MVASIIILLLIIAVLISSKRKSGAKEPASDTTAATTKAEVTTTNKPEETTTTEDVVTNPKDFYKDTLFIGDSRTEGLMMYTDLGEYATFYSKVGLNISKAMDEAFVDIDGSKVTILDALKANHYSKIYIMLGFNELGWPNDYVFVDKYQSFIESISKLEPDATIYLESILHVTEEHSNSNDYENNPRINKYNKNIKALANGKNVKYINLNPAFDDENKTLKKDSTTDGIHLKAEYYDTWMNYLIQQQ